MNYPRILFVTPHAFNGVTGGGITFSALFRGWPQDAIATVHNDQEPVTTDVCRTYFFLTPKELELVWPLGSVRRRAREARPETSDAPAIHGRPLTTAASHMKRLARSGLLAVAGTTLPDRGVLSEELEAWIRDFRPQLIYSILGTVGMMQLVEKVRVCFDLPLVVHFMDDWPAAAYRDGLLGPLYRWRMQKLLSRLVGCAAARLSISPAMTSAYQERYGVPFEAYQNTIDVKRWSQLAKSAPEKTSRPAEILYVGSIFPNAQLDALADCAAAVSLLFRQGRPVRMSISSPSGHAVRYRDRLAVSDCVLIEDTIRDDETFYRRLAAADLLLLPVNFDADTVRFIRYSMPTKVPAYLTIGTPILAYGPRGTAQIDYALAGGWAFPVTEPGVEGLAQSIARALDDADERRRVSAAAIRCAKANHDAEAVRMRFQNVLLAAAKSERAGARA